MGSIIMAIIVIWNRRLQQEVTVRKQAEEKLKAANKMTKAANLELKKLDRLKSMFIASMSHELRTPLNSIIGFTGVILQGMSGEVNERQKDQLSRVNGAAHHLLHLINEVIDISKIEAEKNRCISQWTCSWMRSSTKRSEPCKSRLANKGLTLTMDVPQELKFGYRQKTTVAMHS